MKRAHIQSRFLARAREHGWVDGPDLAVVDVGASGSLDPFWRQFEPQLRAVGFDPLQAEVDRLNELEQNPKVHYEACWVGDGPLNEPLDDEVESDSYFAITSAARAFRAADVDYVKEEFNSGQEVQFTETRIGIDSWLDKNCFGNVDVLKTDTDGSDFGVLNSARNLLSEGSVLAVVAECQFHEPIGQRAPVFSEIDSLLRRSGYRLFDIDVWRYTRSSLPGKFQFDIFAQTTGGQAQFCDALYMLDPMADVRAYKRLTALSDTSKLAKLVFLYEAFGLGDCAAALLEKLREDGVTAGNIDIEKALDLLVPENPWGAVSHATFLSEFDRDPRALFPSRAPAVMNKEDRSYLTRAKRFLWRTKKKMFSHLR